MQASEMTPSKGTGRIEIQRTCMRCGHRWTLQGIPGAALVAPCPNCERSDKFIVSQAAMIAEAQKCLDDERSELASLRLQLAEAQRQNTVMRETLVWLRDDWHEWKSPDCDCEACNKINAALSPPKEQP